MVFPHCTTESPWNHQPRGMDRSRSAFPRHPRRSHPRPSRPGMVSATKKTCHGLEISLGKHQFSTGGCRFSQNKIWDIVLASFFGSETMKFFHEWLVIVCMESSCRGGNWLEPQKSGASRYQQEKQEWNWYESGLMWATLDLKKQAHSFGVPEKKTM